MMMNAFFELGPILIRILDEAAITSICLSIAPGEAPDQWLPKDSHPQKGCHR